LRAQQAPEKLEAYVTTATRTPAAPQTLGSAVEVITAGELATRQITSVSTAIASAGAPVFASGAEGSARSLFLRGSASNQTLFLVDGIRLNDPNTDYQAFLGGASLGATDRIEIARGPQSTLYGAEAMGGVISLSSPRGTGNGSATISAEAGSFGSANGTIAGQGASGANAWNFSLRGAHTNNDRPNNDLDSGNLALRLDRTVTDRVGVGSTLRWYFGKLGSPGDRYTNDPNNTESESNLLATTFADVKLADGWTAHAILGGQNRRYVAKSPAPNPPYDYSTNTVVVTNRRGILDLQTSYTGIERNRFTVGGTAEATHTHNTGYGAINRHQTLLAAFAQDELSLSDNLYVTAGLRADDFDTFGSATTGRATIAWLPIPRTLKLRASYGTGFRSPGFLDLYGQDAYYVGNPNLSPERQKGADAGIDYYLPNNLGTLSATWFESDFRNLIDYDFSVFPSTAVNIGKARTKGVELAARAHFAGFQGSLSYTYLDAQALNRQGHTRLVRRPRHSVSADLNREFGHGVTAGTGLTIVAKRRDIDALTYSQIDGEDYTAARVYATWQATPQLALKARLENVLNEKYEEVNGYPALGFGAFGGVEWKF
jgi:vitamin B12 transporter